MKSFHLCCTNTSLAATTQLWQRRCQLRAICGNEPSFTRGGEERKPGWRESSPPTWTAEEEWLQPPSLLLTRRFCEALMEASNRTNAAFTKLCK